MNSVQQFSTNSRASLATRTLGQSSLIILFMAALGIVNSSSVPGKGGAEDELEAPALPLLPAMLESKFMT